MDYLCDAHLKKAKEADQSLQKIIGFNSTQNFYPENALATVWAYEKLDQRDKAEEWLNEKLQVSPTNKKLLWSKSVFEKSNTVTLSETEKNANVRIIEQLMLMK